MTKLWLIVFCFLKIFSRNVDSVCIDKNALNAVNATVHQSLTRRGFVVLNTNFYMLDNYIAIDVINANVTDLCEGMIKNFPKLKRLSLINVNLSKIQPNAFQKISGLHTLSLAVNNLTEIVKGSFDNLDSLKILYLSGNRIASIESGTFNNMQNLQAVHLDRNEIVEINGNLFNGCPKIRTLDFGFNFIKDIRKTSFQDLKPDNDDPIIIFLNKNRIDDIDAMAFDMNNPVYLHLENNLVSSLTELFHGVKDYSRIYLNNNEITCVPDDVIQNLYTSSKELHVSDNPLACECVNRIDQLFEDKEVYGTGKIDYNSTFPCQLINFDK